MSGLHNENKPLAGRDDGLVLRLLRDPSVALGLRLIVGIIFCVSAAAKLAHMEAFVRAVAAYGVLPDFAVRPLALVFPWLELLVGVFLVVGLFTWLAALVAAILMIGFIALISVAMLSGKDIDCGCFVGLIQETVGPGTLVRDIIMLALLVPLMLRPRPGYSVDSFLADRGVRSYSIAGTAAVCAIVALVLGFGITNSGNIWSQTPAASSQLPVVVPTADTAAGPIVERPAGGWRLGPEDAPVVVTVFSDFQCNSCRQVDDFLKELIAERPNEVALVFKHYPLQGHEYSLAASEAAEAAGEQGQFWPMHHSIFANQDRMSPDALRLKAQALGLDMARYDASLASDRPKAMVAMDGQEGERLGVEFTPYILINGEPFTEDTFSALRTAVEQQLSD